jgi:hypothetical protein
MSTISSNQEKRHGLVNPMYVLFFFVLILVLLLVGSFASNASNSISGALEALSGAPAGVSAGANVSFTADQQYWDANCTGGWSSDSTCETIVQRVQSCSISTDSTYCSAYELYLQTFRNP